MPITVNDPDGKPHSFADGTPTDAINTEMERRWATRATPNPQPTPLQAPGKMPPGTSPGPMTGKSSSLLEQEMVPLSAEAQRGMRMIAGGGATNNRALEMAGRMIVEKDPTFQARKKQSEAIGEQAGARTTSRIVGENVLGSYAKLLHSFNNTDDDTLQGAIGPRNMMPLQETSPTLIPFTNIPIPGLSGPTTIDPTTRTAVAGQITPVQRAAILNPNDPSVAAAWDTQNLFGHDVHGITNALAAGAAKGMRMTDERQKMFDSTMRDFMQGTNRAAGAKILDHAKSIIQNDFNLTPDEADAIVKSNMDRIAKEEQQKMLVRAAKMPPEAVSEFLGHVRGNPQDQKNIQRHIRLFNKNFNDGERGLAEALIKAHTQPQPAQ